jgi:hypothetical protein
VGVRKRVPYGNTAYPGKHRALPSAECIKGLEASQLCTPRKQKQKKRKSFLFPSFSSLPCGISVGERVSTWMHPQQMLKEKADNQMRINKKKDEGGKHCTVPLRGSICSASPLLLPPVYVKRKKKKNAKEKKLRTQGKGGTKSSCCSRGLHPFRFFVCA